MPVRRNSEGIIERIQERLELRASPTDLVEFEVVPVVVEEDEHSHDCENSSTVGMLVMTTLHRRGSRGVRASFVSTVSQLSAPEETERLVDVVWDHMVVAQFEAEVDSEG